MKILRMLSKTNNLNSCIHVQCNRKKNINLTMSLAVVSIFPRNREAEVRFRVDNSVFFSLIFFHYFFALLFCITFLHYFQ